MPTSTPMTPMVTVLYIVDMYPEMVIRQMGGVTVRVSCVFCDRAISAAWAVVWTH